MLIILLGLFRQLDLQQLSRRSIQTTSPVVRLADVLLLVKAQTAQPQFLVKCTFSA